ncbi:hypothetical protein B0T10DRAFT_558188 [Thelonectria olida]|uniref:Uncharacterized protein n=1 Tax=Thelonectria olida TaxID=1576542 RepID=A0A9P8WD90_9HYPO|nr:hypothetical protein B0T10DRAFT_558188 [Thelonectria olida]
MAGMKEEIVSEVKEDIRGEVLRCTRAAVHDWVNEKLQQRHKELEEHTRRPLLSGDSSREQYQKFVDYLLGQSSPSWQNAEVYQTEALLSMVVDLQPGLDGVIRDFLKTSSITEQGTAEGDGDIEMGQDDSTQVVEAHVNEQPADNGSDDSDEFNSNYEAPDVPNVPNQDIALPSTEPRTPIVTPRTKAQLETYEQQYCEVRQSTESKEDGGKKTFQHDNGSNRISKKRKNWQEHEIDMDRSNAKHPRMSVEEPDSPVSVASDWSLPSINDLAIRVGSGGSPSQAASDRQVSEKPSGSGFNTKGQQSTQREVALEKQKQQPGKEKGKDQYVFATPLRPFRVVLETPRNQPAEANAGPSSKHSKGKVSGRSRSKLTQAGQGRSEQLTNHSAQDPGSKGTTMPATPSFLRETTADFQTLSPNAKNNMLYRTLRQLVNSYGTSRPPADDGNAHSGEREN